MNFLTGWGFRAKPKEDVVDLREYILGDPLHVGTVLDGMTLHKYVTKASRLVPNIVSWAYNRNVDDEHARKLQDDLLAMQYPHFVGSIKVVCDSEDSLNFRLLDGQHRVMALMNIMKTNQSFDMDLDVDVYFTNNEDPEMTVCELFLKANNNKNVSDSDIPDRKIIEIVELCLKFWPDNIKTDDTKLARRPNIHKRQLYTSIKAVMDKHPDWTPKQWTRRIFEMNEQMRMKPLVEMFGTATPTRTQLATYERARKSDFFLNLDCVFCVEKWTNLL